VAVVELSLSGPRYQDASRRMAFAGEVLEKLQAVPGVEAAAAAAYGIPFDSGKTTFRIQGQPALPAADRPKARYFGVTPNYLHVLGVALMQGRNFSVSDAGSAPPVAMVNRVFAQRYFAGQQPIGRYISVDRDEDGPPVWREIVGIVPDIRASFGPKEEDPQMYVPYLQAPSAAVKCLVRAAGDPNALAPALRRAVWSVDADQPIGDIATIAMRVSRMDAGDRIVAMKEAQIVSDISVDETVRLCTFLQQVSLFSALSPGKLVERITWRDAIPEKQNLSRCARLIKKPLGLLLCVWPMCPFLRSFHKRVAMTPNEKS